MLRDSLAGVALLGWMEREEAVRFLCDDCCFEPAFTVAVAEAFWREYAVRVARLSPAEPSPVRPWRLTADQELPARRFLESVTGTDGGVDVGRVDLMTCVARQLQITSGRYKEARLDDESRWCEAALAVPTPPGDLAMRSAPNAMDIDLPHAEFSVSFDASGRWSLKQGARHVSVTTARNRLVLWAGYHRVYARLASLPAERRHEPSVVVLAETAGSLGRPSVQTERLLQASRPPFLSDFFDESLCAVVPIRRRRHVLQVRSHLAYVAV